MSDAEAGARRPQDLQALHRRRVPALRVGPHLRGRRREREVPRQRRARVTQGRARRGRRGPERVREVVGGDGVQPRADPLPHRRDARGRRAEFVDEVRDAENVRARTAEKVVDTAIDRWVWYAGWSDKLAQVHGSSNPVAGPYFDFSVPEPTGVVAVIAPQQSDAARPRLGRRTGDRERQHVRRRRGRTRPLPAITLTEVLATSDLPAGVVNMLTGSADELAPWLASHMDVNAIDLCGASPSSVPTSSAPPPTTSRGW